MHGNDYYYPEFQLTKRIDVTTERFGVEKISTAWKEVISNFLQPSHQAGQSDVF
ncbi:hypothetical protein [Gracilibacillus salitolerans]|uniref:hypothetical protein n=1 Tax=Gracilibacillus salitolerans TaxID=2663022 RepID=UPI0018916280|nr:hypothetical protein [Gracilibacillus salitolerans]